MTSRFPDAFRCGVAADTVRLPTGAPIAGYGGRGRRVLPCRIERRRPFVRFFRPSAGQRDPIRVKAMVVIEGDRRLLFLSLDVVAVPPDLHDEILRTVEPLGFPRDGVMVSATHTHSGPGGLTRARTWQLVVMDAFSRLVHDAIVTAVIGAVRGAVGRAEPASLSTVSFAADGLQRSRRHDRWFFDPTVNLLLARSTINTRWIGAMANMAIHGTALQDNNLLLSADVPGAIERSLERQLGAPVLFVNGAVGDVSPIMAGTEGINYIAHAFGQQCAAAIPRARRVTPRWSVFRRRLRLPAPHLLSRMPIGGLVPREVELNLIRLGDLAMLTWPGEPTTTLGLAAKGVAGDAGTGQPWILGLTNGYAGYFVAPDEHRAGGYEAAKSFYGATAGITLVEAYRALLSGSDS
ncbi:MAG: neutral/alkaline non-lysosomal ceramidase N-terminal domain-containing protein [Vicinamibacterales bacterium]